MDRRFALVVVAGFAQVLSGCGNSNSNSSASSASSSSAASSAGSASTTEGSSATTVSSGSNSGGTTASSGAGSSGSAGTSGTGPCTGTSVFCDDFTQSSLASAYTTFGGTWVRSTGTYTVMQPTQYVRAASLLSDDVVDFDVTVTGHALGDSGWGFEYAATDQTLGYTVLYHPGQYLGLYLKGLNPSGDTTLAQADISALVPDASHVDDEHTLRVTRSAGLVKAYVDGALLITQADGASTAHGRLGLITSTTSNTAGAGAVFTLLRIDTASVPQTSASSSGSSSGTSTGTSGSTSSTGSTGSGSGACSALQGPDPSWQPMSYDVLVQVGQLNQALIDANPANTKFALAAGVHRLTSSLTIYDGDQLLGFPGAVISGGRDISTGWTSDGQGHWYVSGQNNFAHATFGGDPNAGNVVCGSNPYCQYAEDVYLDHAFLTQVGSLSAVTAGTFFWDETAKRIYLGADPTGHLVETDGMSVGENGASPNAAINCGTGNLIQNLVFEEFDTSEWAPAILLGTGTSQLVNSKVWLNHMDGVAGYGSTEILNSILTYNGENGISNAVKLVQNNEIAYNNALGYSTGFNAAGLKFANPGTSDTTITGNWVHDNKANGLWLDTVGSGNVIQYNTVENNEGGGMSIEASAGIKVQNNLVRGNGSVTVGWYLYGCGILISDSSDSEVSSNYADGNNSALLVLVSNGRADGSSSTPVSNVSVHDNDIALSGTPTTLPVQYQNNPSGSAGGFVCGYGASSTQCAGLPSDSWTNNHYYSQSTGAAWFAENSTMLSFTQWQALGKDSSSTMTAGALPAAPTGVGCP